MACSLTCPCQSKVSPRASPGAPTRSRSRPARTSSSLPSTLRPLGPLEHTSASAQSHLSFKRQTPTIGYLAFPVNELPSPPPAAALFNFTEAELMRFAWIEGRELEEKSTSCGNNHGRRTKTLTFRKTGEDGPPPSRQAVKLSGRPFSLVRGTMYGRVPGSNAGAKS